MNAKYKTVRLESNRLIINKGNSCASIKVYEYDMLKCRGILNEDELVKSTTPVDFIGSDVDYYYNELCHNEKMYDWYIYLKSNNEPIGNITADREIDEINSIELAFNLHPNYWKHGYMKEAVSCVITYLFDIGYENIIMSYDDGNKKSKLFIENLGAKFYNRVDNSFIKDGQSIGTTSLIISKSNWKER